MGIHEVTRGYKGLQRVTRGYRGLQGVTKGYRELQGVTRGYTGLQGVTGGYKWLKGVTRGYRGLQRIIETFFYLERSQILLLGLFCIKIKVEDISNFSPKPWTNAFANMPVLCVFETHVFVVQKGLFAI